MKKFSDYMVVVQEMESGENLATVNTYDLDEKKSLIERLGLSEVTSEHLRYGKVNGDVMYSGKFKETNSKSIAHHFKGSAEAMGKGKEVNVYYSSSKLSDPTTFYIEDWPNSRTKNIYVLPGYAPKNRVK